jgi:hypothetical protein
VPQTPLYLTHATFRHLGSAFLHIRTYVCILTGVIFIINLFSRLGVEFDSSKDFVFVGSLDDSIGIATGADGLVSIRGSVFSLLYIVQTYSGTYPASKPVWRQGRIPPP